MERRKEFLVEVRAADLFNPDHADAILDVLNVYAQEQIILGKPLSAEVKNNLISSLQAHSGTHVFLAFVDGSVVGVAVCFLGFSTFRAKPLLNIHDLAVQPSHRGQGVGFALLAHAEKIAKELGCCKLTLEVSQENIGARGLYIKFGFDPGQAESTALSFLTKNF